jgi:predicted secreted hydrolase
MRTDGFAQVLEPRTFEFPRDHGSHPEYRQEWWYVTGNLDSAAGERFGFELTFFRFALAPPVTDASASKPVPEQTSARGSKTASDTAAAVAPTSGTAIQPPRTSDGRAAPNEESHWRTRQIYMAHFAITDVARKRFRFAQKLSRGALGLAGAQMPPLRVWIDDWTLGAPGVGGGGEGGKKGGAGVVADAAAEDGRWSLRAVQDGYELTLDARALLAPVLNGDHGLSRKSSEPGSASYYYSIPRVAVRGQLLRDGKPVDVKGLAWVDREWGSGTLSKSEQGWDWFALQLKDGSTLMFYALRTHGGGRDPNSGGTWVTASGESRELSNDQVQIDVKDYWTNPRGERYPSRWRVRVPVVGVDVEVRPVLANQELTTLTRYWEGAVDVTEAGTSDAAAHEIVGRGYVELVGYAAQ